MLAPQHMRVHLTAKRRSAQLPLFSVMSLIGVIVSAGCALVPLEEQQTPTSASYADTAYPGPDDATQISVPPTMAVNSPETALGMWWVTPSPDDKAQIGALTELASAPSEVLVKYAPHSRFTGKTVFPVAGSASTSYIVIIDNQTGQEIARLGDESSHAVLEGMNDEYVVWSCGKCASLPYGSYVYHLPTAKQVVIREGNRAQYPKLSGEWVVYVTFSVGRELRAYNLTSGQDLLVTQDLTARGGSYQGPSSLGDYYALRDSRVMWVTTQVPGSLYRGLSVYDLVQRTKRDLVLPDTLGGFYRPDIFGDIAVWQTRYWQGYDLRQDAYFSIPVIPPGWENVPVEKVSPVMASEGQLYWSLTVMGQAHYFSAPVVPKGEAPLTQAPLPTPLGLPPTSPTQALPATALPTDVIPPTSAPPTAYP